MEHSRLLKFILPEGYTYKNKMADPIKIKFEYESPDNIDSEVPSAQKIRECPTDGATEGTSQTITNTVSTHTEQTVVMGGGTASSKYTTNGTPKDIKDEKKTKIPVSRFRQTVEKVKSERAEARKEESHIPIRRSSIPKLKKVKTPQPSVRKELTITTTEVTEKTTAPDDEFDKLYEEIVCYTPTAVNIDISLLNPKVDDPEKLETKFEEIIHDYDENKVQPIDVEKFRRSKIPFLKRRSQQDMDVKGQAERSSRIVAARDKLRQRHSSSSEQYDIRKELSNISDSNTDFNNTKQEVITDNISKVEDASLNHPKSETAITTNHTKTIIETSSNANEKDSSSKVVGTTRITEITTNESSDKVQMKQGQRFEENIYKDSIKIGTPVFESYVHEYTEKTKIEKTIEAKRVLSYTSNNESDFIIEKKDNKVETLELKDEPRPTIATVDSYVISTDSNESEKVIAIKKQNENVEESENRHQQTTEIIDISDNTNNENLNKETTEIVDISKNESVNYDADKIMSKVHADTEHIEQVMKEKDGSVEDIAKLRGKVSKLISKIDSHQPETPKKEYPSEPPKNESMLSKIAMFENREGEPANNIKLPKIKCKSKLVTKEIKGEEHIHIHTPLIVEEVFKPFELISNNNQAESYIEVTTNGDGDINKIEKHEMVVIESPEVVRYDIENKFQIKSNTLTIEQAEVEEEILTTVPSKSKNELTTNNEKEISRDIDVPVVIPRFVPVREVLKRYESLNETKDATLSKEAVLDSNRHSKEVLPNIRPISTIISDLKPEIYQNPLPKQKEAINEITSEFKASNDGLNTNADNDVFVETTEQLNAIEKPIQNINRQDHLESLTINRTREFKSLRQDDNFATHKSLDIDLKAKSRNDDDMRRARSLAELDLGDAVKGKVNKMIVRMNSMEKMEVEMKETAINIKEMPRKRSVSEKIALFERKLTPAKTEVLPPRTLKLRTDLGQVKRSAEPQPRTKNDTFDKSLLTDESVLTEDFKVKIEQLSKAKVTYGKMVVPTMEISNGQSMPILAVGTALLDPRLVYHVVTAAIDLGYRAIDTAYIYGNERQVGEAIRAKIADGTVTRDELFVISKLWSTFHREELVREACQGSLTAMGLQYFDLYLIHNPMSFKEGGSPIPKIASVIQYSEYDYLDAWRGMEALGGRARALGVSNFNARQLRRLRERARVQPVINQVECHPYLTQHKLDEFCGDHNITLSCFGVLGSKGTPSELKSGHLAAIDDPLVQVMAAGLSVSPAQLLIRYQIQCGHAVVVKASTAAHLWDNLQALTFTLTSGQVEALHALNRNKRNFTFKGMGDTHKNYPFNTPF